MYIKFVAYSQQAQLLRRAQESLCITLCTGGKTRRGFDQHKAAVGLAMSKSFEVFPITIDSLRSGAGKAVCVDEVWVCWSNIKQVEHVAQHVATSVIVKALPAAVTAGMVALAYFGSNAVCHLLGAPPQVQIVQPGTERVFIEAHQKLKVSIEDIKESVFSIIQHCFLVFVLRPGQTTTCGRYDFLRVERAKLGDDLLNCLPIHFAT